MMINLTKHPTVTTLKEYHLLTLTVLKTEVTPWLHRPLSPTMVIFRLWLAMQDSLGLSIPTSLRWLWVARTSYNGFSVIYMHPCAPLISIIPFNREESGNLRSGLLTHH